MTGIGLDIVRRYLHLLPPGVSHKEQQKLEQNPPEFQIDEIFDVPGVGTVVGGINLKNFYGFKVKELITISELPFI